LFVLLFRSYDVIFLAPWETIVEKFKESRAKVLFGAENFCWPDEGLKTKYPLIEGSGQKYLNSGLIMGYAKNLYNILTSRKVKDTEDDQLFYTNIYLDDKMREENGIKLDHKSNLFQNLNGNVGEYYKVYQFDLVLILLLPSRRCFSLHRRSWRDKAFKQKVCEEPRRSAWKWAKQAGAQQLWQLSCWRFC
jgi:hypothetical protein